MRRRYINISQVHMKCGNQTSLDVVGIGGPVEIGYPSVCKSTAVLVACDQSPEKFAYLALNY